MQESAQERERERERAPALIFTVRGRAYGLPQGGAAVAVLPWMRRYTPASPVPGVPAWMLGLLHVHGTVQPIVDLGLFMGHGEGARDGNGRLIFIERGELCAGLLVDGASGIRYLDPARGNDGATGAHKPGDGDDSGDGAFVAATAPLNGAPVRLLDGGRLLDALAGALGAPGHGRGL